MLWMPKRSTAMAAKSLASMPGLLRSRSWLPGVSMYLRNGHDVTDRRSRGLAGKSMCGSAPSKLVAPAAAAEAARKLRRVRKLIEPSGISDSTLTVNSSARRGLEDREHRLLRICHHRETSDIRNIHGRRFDGTAQLLDFGGRHVAVCHQEIRHPMRRSVASPLRAHLHHAARGPALIGDFGVLVRVRWIGFRRPPEEFAVKLDSGRFIARDQLGPAQRARNGRDPGAD